MSAHTKGPWMTTGCAIYREAPDADSGKQPSLAGVAGEETSIEEDEANARLIAAAPEMLARLKYEHEKAAPVHGNFDIEGCDSCAAIAKAEGR